jgi:hypothetical protein
MDNCPLSVVQEREESHTSWATGFGLTYQFSSNPSRYLMEVLMPVLTNKKCEKKYGNVKSEFQLCAGEVGGRKDTCQVK